VTIGGGLISAGFMIYIHSGVSPNSPYLSTDSNGLQLNPGSSAVNPIPDTQPYRNYF